MPTADHVNGRAPQASDVAKRLHSSSFVHLIGAQSGDAAAAIGLLTSALSDLSIPFQAAIEPVYSPHSRETPAETRLGIGRPPGGDGETALAIGANTPASKDALDVVRALCRSEDCSMATTHVELAMAGIFAAGAVPGSDLRDLANEYDLDRRPGVAIPTADAVDGLAHSTAFHTSFSGSVSATETTMERRVNELSNEGNGDPAEELSGERVASILALTLASDMTASTTAASRAESILRPHAGSRFETVGGFGDVLRASAADRPDLALQLAMGAGDHENALSSWRSHGKRAHEAITSGTTSRFDGLYVHECANDAPLSTVAQLVRDYRSPEPTVLVLDDNEAILVRRWPVATDEDETTPSAHQDSDVSQVLAEATGNCGGQSGGTPVRARATVTDDRSTFVDAVKEAL